MGTLEITSMSTKGQIVLPLKVRNEAHLASGAKFVVMTDGENILLKPIESPNLSVFKNLLKRSKTLVKDSGVKHEQLARIIKKDRSENRT